jgi:hypothetical protein
MLHLTSRRAAAFARRRHGNKSKFNPLFEGDKKVNEIIFHAFTI